MSVRSYTDIIVDGNHFSIVEHAVKPQGVSALSTLSRIDKVMKKRLQYAEGLEDNFSALTQDALYAELKNRAEAIRDGYVEKAKKASPFTRFFWNVSKKERVIQIAFNRIENLAEPSSVFKLPEELIQQHICGFLQAGDLGRLAQVSVDATNYVKQAELQRARKYGYKGEDFTEAKKYLQSLFLNISTFVKDGLIREEYVVRKGKYVDSEATLIKVRELKLKNYFSKVLLNYVQNFDKFSYDERQSRLRALIQLGADPNFRDAQGRTPLMVAQPIPELISLLLYEGADQNIGSGILRKFVNFPQIVHLLCERGAKVDLLNVNGETALHNAARYDKRSMSVLLRFGADPNIRNNQGNTPLLLACNYFGSYEAISLLLEKGADPKIVSNNGTSPLHRCQNNLGTVRLLCEKGARVNFQDSYGRSALHYAVERKDFTSVGVLLEFGADRNLRDNQGKTAYDLLTWIDFLWLPSLRPDES